MVSFSLWQAKVCLFVFSLKGRTSDGKSLQQNAEGLPSVTMKREPPPPPSVLPLAGDRHSAFIPAHEWMGCTSANDSKRDWLLSVCAIKSCKRNTRKRIDLVNYTTLKSFLHLKWWVFVSFNKFHEKSDVAYCYIVINEQSALHWMTVVYFETIPHHPAAVNTQRSASHLLQFMYIYFLYICSFPESF